MRALSGTTWGCQLEDLRMIYLTYIRSTIDYCAASWLPNISHSNVDKLETIQNCSARIMTGCVKGTNTEHVLSEASLLSINERQIEHAVIAYEKYKRVPESNPTKKILQTTVKKRLTSVTSVNDIGKSFIDNSLLKNCTVENLSLNKAPPWQNNSNTRKKIEFHDQLIDSIKKSDPVNKIRDSWDKTYNCRHKNGRYEVWSDGSVIDGTENGGSGTLIIDKKHKTSHEITRAAGKLSSSFRTELLAISCGLEWLKENAESEQVATIFSDSKSVILRLKAGPSTSASELEVKVWQMLGDIVAGTGPTINFQWCPGHCDIEQNERADRLAKNGRENPIDFNSAKIFVQRSLRKEWTNHRKKIKTDLESKFSRRERRILSQLRSPDQKCPLLQSYLFNIGKSTNASCGECGEEIADVKHLIESCPQLAKWRHQLLGRCASVSDLWERPRQVISMLAKGGRLGGRRH